LNFLNKIIVSLKKWNIVGIHLGTISLSEMSLGVYLNLNLFFSKATGSIRNRFEDDPIIVVLKKYMIILRQYNERN